MVRGFFLGAVGIGIMAGTVWAGPGLSPILTEDFSNDPVANGRAVIQSDDAGAASRFVSNPGYVTASYNTSELSVKMVFPLGRTLTQNDTFAFTTTLDISPDGYAPDPDSSAQIAFGLINSITTGLDRTGSPADFSGDDTYDTMTVDYFPNQGFPTITPTEFNSNTGAGEAFSGLNAPFNNESLINDPGEVQALSTGDELSPRDKPYTFRLDYDAATRTMTVTLNDSNDDPADINQLGDGNVVGGPDGNVDTIQYTLPGDAVFSVNSFGLLLWQDGYDKDFSSNSSLIATVDFDQFTVLVAPEPASLAVIALPMACLLWRRRRAGA